MSKMDSRVEAARDLRAIETMEAALLTQAVGKANDPLMPGGLAMVALGVVANQEAFGHVLDAAEQRAIMLAERFGIDADKLMPAVEDDDWEPPLQTLCFWSEQWRAERGQEFESPLSEPSRAASVPTRPTIATEANFLRYSLDWAWKNELHWDSFVKDLAKARARIEAVLLEGARPVMRGVPCMYDECKGARLMRTTVKAANRKGETYWRLTDWHCPRCKRSWDEESYGRNVYAAMHRAKSVVAEFDGQTEVWCTVDLAAKRVGRAESTVRVWLHRGQVAEFCGIGAHKRWRYILLSDVEWRDHQARERWARRQSAILSRIKALRVAA